MKTYQLTESQIRELVDVCYNNSKSETLKWIEKTFEMQENQSKIIDELCAKYPNDFELGMMIRKYSYKKNT